MSNLALIAVTLGVYTPWAQVRLARYRLSAIELEAHGSLDEFAAPPRSGSASCSSG
jgi:uncharacterized membrane protein YjgN (DUF898 family)